MALSAAGSMGVVAAYQMGLLKHLPEPPLAALDADKVDASGEAYQYFRTPDAALGLASYAATLVLAGMGSDRRAEEQPWIPLVLAAKVGLDAASGLYLTVEQASKHRRFCSWCLLAAGLSAAMVPQVVPEARTAWGHLRASPVTDVRGEPVPEERKVDGVAGWAGSLPIRVGNSAGGQVQHDALGLVLEGISVHLQTGAPVDDDTWSLVKLSADRAASAARRN